MALVGTVEIGDGPDHVIDVPARQQITGEHDVVATALEVRSRGHWLSVGFSDGRGRVRRHLWNRYAVRGARRHRRPRAGVVAWLERGWL
jgi:hypothetical protein